jgi:hypothetical protein
MLVRIDKPDMGDSQLGISFENMNSAASLKKDAAAQTAKVIGELRGLCEVRLRLPAFRIGLHVRNTTARDWE